MTKQSKKPVKPERPRVVQLSDEWLDEAVGGASYAPIQFTKRVDKATP